MLQLKLMLLLMVCGFVAVAVAWYPLRRQRWVIGVVWTVFWMVVLGVTYTHFGAYSLRETYLHELVLQKEARALSKKGLPALVQRMQWQLKKHPDSERGWYLLGRLYASQQQWRLASQAFQHAVRLNPDNTDAILNEVQSLQILNHQQLNATLRHRLLDVLRHHPNQVDALVMLAIDAERMRHDEQAIVYWERLLTLVPEQSPEAPMIRKALARVYHRVNNKPTK